MSESVIPKTHHLMKRIVVCLASYNGARYIGEQLSSILDQIGPGDAVIVSDDNSTDGTVELILGLCDPRIHLFRNEPHNSGYVKNFENALRYAVSIGPFDYVFLSDQDDVWVSDKVSRACEAFDQSEKYIFVCHSLKYVDAQLKPLPGIISTNRQYDPTFLVRGLFKPFAFGCGMAFRFGLLNRILPFPDRYCYTHDHWIELVAYLSGECYYINIPLLLYRRHDISLTVTFASQYKNSLLKEVRTLLSLRVSYCLMALIALKRRFELATDYSEYVSKVVKGYRPITTINGLLISSKNNCLFSSDLELNDYRFICKLPVHVSHFRLLMRLSRLEITTGVKLNDSEILVQFKSEIYFVNITTGLCTLDFSIPEGRKLLKFSVDCRKITATGDVYFGEYFSNEAKVPVRVWRRSEVGTWSIAYTFPSETINHIHAIYLYDDSILVLTGDFGMAAAFWIFGPDFLNGQLLVGGRQAYRACSVFRVGDILYFPTDTQQEGNRFLSIGINGLSLTPRIHGNINGSSIYGADFSDGMYFSTAVEPSDLGRSSVLGMFSVFKSKYIHDYFSYIYRFSVSDDELVPIFRARKDLLPFRLFQFGTFTFPTGSSGDCYVIAYGIGLCGNDGATILLKKASR